MSLAFKSELAPKVSIELRPSKITGIGVFAVSMIPKGQKVADGIAEEDFKQLIPWTQMKEFDQELRKKIWDFCIGTPEGFIPPPDLDFNKLSIEWYLNHSCDGNCGFNEDGDFVAITPIDKESEVTYDYGLAESNPNFVMQCICGGKTCRKLVTGNDWKDENFRTNNWGNMHPHLRHLVRTRP